MNIKSIVSTIQRMARWYLRRRRIVRVGIFLLLFVVPAVFYAVSHTPSREEIMARVENMSKPNENPRNITLQPIPFLSLVRGKVTYYVGTLHIYGDNLYMINGTYYLYYYNRTALGLLIDFGRESKEVFILSTPYRTSFRNYSINYLTLILPARSVPPLPSWLKPIICSFVGNTTDPYTASSIGTITSYYKEACH
jgi:hypothetical protein